MGPLGAIVTPSNIAAPTTPLGPESQAPSFFPKEWTPMANNSTTSAAVQDRKHTIQSVLDAAKELQTKVSAGRFDAHDHVEFLRIINAALVSLSITKSELSLRAGKSPGYVAQILTGRTLPRLQSMLSVLAAIADVALDQLSAMGPLVLGMPAGGAPGAFRTTDELLEATQLSAMLAELARREIEALRSKIPNDPLAVPQHTNFIEMLQKFADGFDKIHRALTSSSNGADRLAKQRQATSVAQTLSQDVTNWLKKHGEELIGSTVRLSLMAAGVAALNICGANMKIATGLVGAAVLAPSAATAAKKVLSKRRSKQS